MLKNMNFVNVIVIDVFLGCVWHFLTFVICVNVDTSHFDADKKIYRPHKWEKEGRVYSDILKINKWKHLLPQYIGKNGFSKDHLDDTSIPYLDEFIMETCRAEWNHTANCLFAVVLLLLNELLPALALTLILFAVNLPFVLIQRYNRFRLQRLKDIMMRKMRLTRLRA